MILIFEHLWEIVNASIFLSLRLVIVLNILFEKIINPSCRTSTLVCSLYSSSVVSVVKIYA